MQSHISSSDFTFHEWFDISSAHQTPSILQKDSIPSLSNEPQPFSMPLYHLYNLSTASLRTGGHLTASLFTLPDTA